MCVRRLLVDVPGEQLKSFTPSSSCARSIRGIRVVTDAATDVGDPQRAAAELDIADVVAETLEQPLVGAVGADDIDAAVSTVAM